MGSTTLYLGSSHPGELPPPPPRVCYGRDELIEKVIDLTENLTPIALIGTGGIGKTSIALTILHHDRVREHFGDNRRFIRCDKFPASHAHFLSRLSKVVGAGVDNPEDLAPLRPFLSSMEMILVLDNAESLLDPLGTGGREVFNVVEELSQLRTICLLITSRISTVPRDCKRPIIPPLSVESACNIFYGIHNNGGRSEIISNLLRRLDFHALSIILLATVASHNMRDYDRLAQEWDTHRIQILRTDHNESMAATIELSLASPTFRQLGPNARDLLGVIAFFPQGVDEKNLDWLFPDITNRRTMVDKFCILSLTYRSSGFVTMLAPLREYLRPENPLSSPLLQAAKERYFSRLSIYVSPGKPGFEEAQWIKSEDVNVEHLLDTFTSIDPGSVVVWDACHRFMQHLYWHNRRLVTLGPKVEGLPDDHPSKPMCLNQLSLLFGSVGNIEERKRLLVYALELWREQGDDSKLASALILASGANRGLRFHKEGIRQVEEALAIYGRLHDTSGQAHCLQRLARLLYRDNQLDAAEDIASRAIDLLSDEGDQFDLCRCHGVLGDIYRFKGEVEKAIHHYEAALSIASSLNSHDQLFWNHRSLAKLYFYGNRPADAHAHTERAKSHVTNDAYLLGRATEQQARFWYRERKFKEARAEALRAVEIYAKLGNPKYVGRCKAMLRDIGKEMRSGCQSRTGR